MKILIPTDFSPLSRRAVEYAIDLSKDYELDLVFLHVMNSSVPAMARLSSSKLQDVIETNAEKDMDQLIKDIRNYSDHKMTIRSEIISDSSIKHGVEVYATKNDIDLICVGTKGATGLNKVLFGSNAAGIIGHSSIPVLTIPEYAKYNGVNNLVYSSDFENLTTELQLLVPFTKFMNAWIHVLHVTDEIDDFKQDLPKQTDELKKSLSFEKITSKVLENDSIINGINEYVAEIDADMVAMFTHKASLIDKLIHRSITQMAAFQTSTPLLTFQKN